MTAKKRSSRDIHFVLPAEQVKELDRAVKALGFPTRSEWIREKVRECIAQARKQ